MLVGGTLCLGVTWFVPAANALSVSPSVIEERLQPGESKILSLTVVNDEKEPVQLYVTLQKFLPLGTGGQQQFLPPSDVDGLPSWTFISVPDTPLKPGEKRNIPVQLRVPLETSQGGVYEAIFLSTQRPAGVDEPNIGLRSRIGVLVLLQVGNPAKAVLRLTDWRWDEVMRMSSLRGRAYVTLLNAGINHVRPTGELVVRNMWGRVVTRVSLNPDAVRVLPASERTFEVKIGSVLQTDGWWDAVLDELTFFGLGSYTISLEQVDGLDAVPSPLRVSVWPRRILVSGLVLLGMLLVALRLYRSWLMRRLGARSS